MRHRAGLTLPEVLAVLAIGILAASVAVPALERLRREGRLAAAARRLAITFQALRWRSVAEGRGHAVAFGERNGQTVWWTVRDDDGDGVRRDDMADGSDPVLSGPHRPLDHDAAVRFGIAAAGIPGVPPAGAPPDPADPVRFPSDLAAFSPAGSSSSGSVFLTDGRDTMAIVLYGPTARVRVWRLREGRWTR